MAHQSPIRNQTSAPGSPIPDKLYFRIGEAARLCEVPAYVLRFWESEFPQLRPNKGGTGQRLYRRRDVEMALRIKCLLYDEGYTIPGARQLLKGETKQTEFQLPLVSSPTAEALPEGVTSQLERLRAELRELLNMLSRPELATAPVRAQRPAASPRTEPLTEPQTEDLFDRPNVPGETVKEPTHE